MKSTGCPLVTRKLSRLIGLADWLSHNVGVPNGTQYQKLFAKVQHLPFFFNTIKKRNLDSYQQKNHCLKCLNEYHFCGNLFLVPCEHICSDATSNMKVGNIKIENKRCSPRRYPSNLLFFFFSPKK
jgi:hypothetical protein